MENPKKFLCIFIVWLVTLTAKAGDLYPLQGCLGTYHGEPRLPSGRVDIARLLSRLQDTGVDTYSWLIWSKPTDWDDLKLFLPAARKAHIKVWVTLVPPSESPPSTRNYSEPFRLDYARWATEIARLGLKERNLVAWSVDDFPYNLETFSTNALGQILQDARKINPKLAFVPCCYFGQLKPKFIQAYAPLMDGVLFPYRAESSRHANTTNATYLVSELTTLRQRLGRSMPIVVDIYATKHSQHVASSPEYVEAVMKAARANADGVMIYCQQDPDTEVEKYRVVKTLFNGWSKATVLYPPKMSRER